MALKLTSAVAGGVAGACALTMLHEGARKIDKNAPRLDALGMNAMAKILKGTKLNIPPKDDLFQLTLAGEILSNAAYFGLAGIGSRKNIFWRSAALGLAAGLGALILPKYLGLEDEASNRTNKTKIMTIAWYALSSMVAAATIKSVKRKTKP